MAKRLIMTRRAQDMIAERAIDRIWIERVLANPDETGVDARNPNRRFAFGRIGEFGNRWLRVVFIETRDEWKVLTAFFDRGKGKRP